MVVNAKNQKPHLFHAQEYQIVAVRATGYIPSLGNGDANQPLSQRIQGFKGNHIQNGQKRQASDISELLFHEPQIQNRVLGTEKTQENGEAT